MRTGFHGGLQRYPGCVKDQHEQARATVGQLINLTRAGELDTVVGALTMLTYIGDRQRERLRHILGALIEATGAMLLGKASSLKASGTFGADLRRADESVVDIDSLDPPVRATIRALLAEVNEHPEDTADQLDLAVAGEAQETVEAVALALQWTVDAVESCEDSGVPLPEWLHAS
jgi:hypothetical protein